MTEYPELIHNDDNVHPLFDFKDIEYINNIEMCSNLQELLHSLTRECTSLLDKIGAIFYWIIIDKSRVLFEKALPNSEEFKYNQFMAKLSWRPKLFEFLCRQLDVACYTIEGIVRTLSNQTTFEIEAPSDNHSWNCVFMDSNWYLCDIHWASRVIVKSNNNILNNEATETEKECSLSSNYFMAPPIKFRSTHFPSDNKFQLLSECITLEQFSNLPIFTEGFYDSILSEFKFDMAPLISNDGYFNLSIPFKGRATFVHLLEYYDEKLNKLITKFQDNQDVKTYSLLEMENDNVKLYCRFPLAGVYYFTLFIQEVEEYNLNFTFKALMKWKIQCKVTDSAISPFFGCHDVALGPSWPHLNYYGLIPVNLTRGIIQIDYSPPAYIEAYFNKLNPDVTIVAKIRGSKTLLPPDYKPEISQERVPQSYYGESLDWLIDEEDETDSEITITVRLPTYGEYSLEIFANIPNEGTSFVQVAQYMFDVKQHKTDLIGGNI